MEFIKTLHPDVIRIKPKVFYDERGFFMETCVKAKFVDAGIPWDFVQENHSSSRSSTLRGLHYQIVHPQGKLVRVIRGEVFDVAIDLRESSPYFGRWVSAFLSAENKEQLWIPPGFAHGFYVTANVAEVIYKTTDIYDPDSERCIKWDDPTIGIEWPIPSQTTPLISEKDALGLPFFVAEIYK